MLVSDNAAYGGTLNDLEEFFRIQGRHFLKETFAQKLQERTEATSKAKQCPHCKKTRSQDEKMKGTVSVHGDITLERCFRYCWHCQHYSFPVEGALGLATMARENGFTMCWFHKCVNPLEKSRPRR